MEIKICCFDFLKDNQRLYAHKARRKKIAMIGVEVANQGSSDLTLRLGDSKLIVDGTSYDAESPETIVRKLSEFTWDMAVFLIFDFHPILSLVDFLILLTGPLYNWRLRNRLRLLSDGDFTLKPGKSRNALIGFRKVPKGDQKIQLVYLDQDGKKDEVLCEIVERL